MKTETNENKREKGTRYEDIACSYLESSGMTVIERNYRKKAGEIDIIANDGKYLVFVEVKYRASTSQGGAMYAISDSKKKRITRVAQWYMAERRVSASQLCRFDAVLIDGEIITHVKQAW